MNTLRKISLIFAALLYCIYGSAEEVHELYFIDAHSQVDDKVRSIDVVLDRMSDNNVKTTLLSSRGKRSWQDILDWSSKCPTQIAPLIRSKGKHYRNNTPEYFRQVRKQIETGKFVGASEILVFHAQKGEKASEVSVDLSDDRVSVLLNESLSQNWPFIIHIEFGSLNGPERQGHMDELEILLNQHPAHPFILIHMGQLNHHQVQELIERHSNIYFLTSHTDPVTDNKSKQPWVNIFSPSKYHFKESWKNLFIAHPDRFVFALDNVWDYHWQESYNEKMKYWRMALSELPANMADMIAHRNAERLWGLQ